MQVNQIIMMVLAFFSFGCLDRVIGCRFGVGQELERGFQLMGSVSLSIIGLFCLSPVLADLLQPVILPVYRF